MQGIVSTAVVVIVAALIIVPWWLNRQTPQPTYQVVKHDGNIELRQYDGMLLATTTVADDRSTAINTGFKRLAGYIFGRHSAPDSDKIAMTAPVMQSKTQVDESRISMTAPVMQSKTQVDESRISMTAPVMQTKAGEQDQSWQVAFVMPKKYSKDTIPKPTDSNVIHITQQSARYLTLRFTGLVNSKRLNHKAMQLREYADKYDLEITGEPIFAFYDPPWIFPWLRRHEVWFLVAKD